MPDTDDLVVAFDVDAPPEALEAWWTDLPEVHEASDPREQPHRIERIEQTEDGGIYETEWRGPLGFTFTQEERLHKEEPGRWRFLVPGPGFTIEDRYELRPQGEGCHLEIRSTITYENALGKLARKLMIPNWKQTFRQTFTDAVAVFEDQRAETGPVARS